MSGPGGECREEESVMLYARVCVCVCEFHNRLSHNPSSTVMCLSYIV